MNQSSKLNCNQLHQKAMDVANKAVLAKKQGNNQSAEKHFATAFDYEKQAAMLLVNDFSKEPSRSVLFRSAAFLAIQAELYREAERMAAFGLSGNPPNEIANELRNAFHESLQHLKLVA